VHLGKTLFWTVAIGLWLGLGYLLLLFTFHFCQGNEWNFALGDDYWLNRWPGALIHWRSPEHKDWENPLREKVTAFSIRDPWVIGKTATAWFAIEKGKHETHYPLGSADDIRRITGLTLAESDLVTDPTSPWFPSRYELIWPWTPRYVAFVGLAYLLLSIGFWLRIRGSKRRRY
jgi:hypothetical protein